MTTFGPDRRCAETPRPPSIGCVFVAMAIIAGMLAAGCSHVPPIGLARPHAGPPYVCPAGHGTCQGPLAAGTYRTDSFQPAIIYSVAAGWSNTEDLDGSFRLARVDPTGSVRTNIFVAIYVDRSPAVAPCSEPLSSATAVTVGGLAGHMVTVARSPGFSDSCPSLSLVGGNATKTLYILTVGTATVIVGVTHPPGRNTVEQYRRLTDPIIDSLAFFPARAPNPPASAATPRA